MNDVYAEENIVKGCPAMIVFFRARWCLLIVTVAVLAGCGLGASSPLADALESREVITCPAGVSAPDSQPVAPRVDWKVEELLYDYAAMQEDVRIQLGGVCAIG